MKRYCNKCGFENAGNVKFCMNCGKELIDIKNQSAPPVEPVAKQPVEVQRPSKQHSDKRFVKSGKIVLTSSKTTTILVAVAVVLSIVAIIFSLVLGPAITLGAGSVDQQKLADNSVSSSKIADGTITSDDVDDDGISKIADDSIDSANIIDSSISIDDLATAAINSLTGLNVIANNSINSSKLEDFSIVANDLANSSITSQKIVDGTISSSDIGTDAVGSDEIASGAVGTSEIADSSVSYGDMAIKIQCGKASGVYNGSTISFPTSFSGTPIVVVTPYNSSALGNAIHATVYSASTTNFGVYLWYEPIGSSGIATAVTLNTAVDLCWIAIYTS